MTQKQQIANHREHCGERIAVPGGPYGIALAVAQQVPSGGAGRVRQAVATLDAKAARHTLDVSSGRHIQEFFETTGDFDHLVFTARVRS